GRSLRSPSRLAVPPRSPRRAVLLRSWSRRPCDRPLHRQGAAPRPLTQVDPGVYCATVPGLRGVVATASTLESCRDQLAEVIEEWVLVRVARGLPVPSLAGVVLTVPNPYRGTLGSASWGSSCGKQASRGGSGKTPERRVALVGVLARVCHVRS